MESTPRPILGSPREAQRLPFPLDLLSRGLRRAARGEARRLHLRPGAGETVLEVHGALGTREARDLKQLVREALASGAGRVTIDLSRAGRVTPAGLAALVEVGRRGGGRGAFGAARRVAVARGEGGAARGRRDRGVRP